MPDVVSLGIIVADVWARPVEQLPAKGTLGLVDEVGLGLGGCAANTARGLAKLGVDVAIAGCVGKDPLGDYALRTMEESGASLSVERVDAPTSATLIVIAPDGERTFMHCTGADGKIDPARVDLDLIRSARIFHIGGVFLMPGFDGEPQAGLLRAAQEAGVTTVVDTAWDDTGRWMSVVAPLLPHTDIFTPSVGEAKNLAGKEDLAEVAQVFLDAGVKLVAIKLGPEGSYWRTADQELLVPAYPITPVDGTGAGDAFVGGVIFGRLRGWDLGRTARFANALGALATSAAGTVTGIPSYAGTVKVIEGWEGVPWGED